MKAYLSSLGCKLNQNEIETLARDLAANGCQVVSDPAQADLIVLNTCTVTQVAARKSGQLARHLHRANSQARIILTGCFAELSAAEAAELPGVHWVVGNQEKERLLDLIRDATQQAPAAARPIAAIPGGPGSLTRKDLPLLRTRASVKIQDGCDNECSYCIVRIARGLQRSRSQEDILAEIQERLQAGYKEIVLTGVHIGAYGRDQGAAQQSSLWELVRNILSRTGVPRLRLSSIEPWDISATHLTLWEDQRLCRHLHLPLQSGCDAVLSRMKRRYTARQFAHVVEAARQAIPDIAITTDLIVGFPGETEGEFRQTLDFVEAMQFARVHIFPYSPRPRTVAALLPNQIAPPIKQERSRILTEVTRRSQVAFWQQFIGRVVWVLWETQNERHEWSGLTDHYLRVLTTCSQDLSNALTQVRISGLTSRGLQGHILETEGTS